MGALTLQSESIYKEPFYPLIPDVGYLPWNSIDALKRITEDTAGVIIEPIQGEGGIRVPDAEFMHALRDRCNEVGAMLIFDEVMTGFGRTGKVFAAEHWGITPDIMVMAKALGGGLPLGAFAGPKSIMQTLSHKPPLSHVTTFGGNPACCAAGHAAFQILLKENLADRAQKIGIRFRRGWEQLQSRFPREILEVREKGRLVGVVFNSNTLTMDFSARCLENGVIVGWTLFHSNILRMAPPLILTDEEIDQALTTIDAILVELLN